MKDFEFNGMTLADALLKLDKPYDKFDEDKKAFRVILKWLLDGRPTKAVDPEPQFEKVNEPIKRKKK